MRIIIFDRELHEPLTVVTLPPYLVEGAKRGGRVTLAVRAPYPPYVLAAGPPPDDTVAVKTVELTFEQVWRHNRRGESEHLFWYAYADDPETTLLLRATFLPGQVGEVQRRERRAYVRGILGSA